MQPKSTALKEEVEVQDPFDPFVAKFLGHRNYSIYQLAGDASTRKYYRVIHDTQSWVLMKWDNYDPANYPFLSVLQHFRRHDIQVPEVMDQSPAEGLVLLEDLGDLTVERKFWENQTQELSLPFYIRSVDELIKIHYLASQDKTDCSAFKVKFDTEKFLWEMNYGRENLLEGICQFKFNDKIGKQIEESFIDICTRLDREPKWIAHRDYHSRNLMIKLDKVRVIDFQDARLGPIQYDLVSLFRDSYVNLSDASVETLIQYYLEQAKNIGAPQVSRDRFNEIFELQTIQRCFKACGSFASFYNQRKDIRYLKYISGTLKKVLKALNEFPEYKVFSDILIDSGALDKKYEAL
jgi:aminoglycoside/choline kinase family phosphotransferase